MNVQNENNVTGHVVGVFPEMLLADRIPSEHLSTLKDMWG